MKEPSILVVATKYPSPEHPYITRLIAALKEHFPGLRLFTFYPGDRAAGEKVITKDSLNKVLEGAYMKGQPALRPGVLLAFLRNLFKNPGLAIKTYRHFRKNKRSQLQAIGQVFYFQELLGQRFDMVYFNAIQIAYHVDIPFYLNHSKILISCRGGDFDLFPTKFDHTLRQADHVHVLGDYLKKQVLHRGTSEEDVTIIPPAYLSAWEPRPTPAYNQPVLKISVASRFSWIKGLEYLVEGVKVLKSMLPGTKVELHLAGDGASMEELKYRVFLDNLEENVIFHGWQNEAEVVSLIKDSFVYCLPSLLEGFNNSVVTAQAIGIPCIVSDVGGLPENVRHKETGLVVPSYDADALARAVYTLWNDRELYENLSSNAVERVKELSFDRHLQAYIRMFEKVLRN